MNLGERVRILRKELNMTLEQFGERVGVGKTAISRIENGSNNLTDQMAKSICREFNVNEDWLRTGEGEMFEKKELFSLNDYVEEYGVSDFELRVLKAYFQLDKDIRLRAMEHFRQHLSESPASPSSLSDRVKEAEEEYIKTISRTAARKEFTASNTTDVKEA